MIQVYLKIARKLVYQVVCQLLIDTGVVMPDDYCKLVCLICLSKKVSKLVSVFLELGFYKLVRSLEKLVTSNEWICSLYLSLFVQSQFILALDLNRNLSS